HPLDAVVRARPLLRARERLLEAPVEDLVHERALPRSRHAGDRDEEPERDPDVDVLEVVLARAAHDEGLRSRLAPPRRQRDATAAGKVCAGDRARLPDDVLHGPLGDHLAAFLAGAGPDVDPTVRRADRLLVVFVDYDRFPGVAHAEARPGWSCVCAMVYPE